MPANRTCAVLAGFALLALNAPGASPLAIRVVDAAGGRPLAGASVQWRVGDGSSATVASDAEGRVRIAIPKQAAGTLHVTASQRGFAPMTMGWDASKTPAEFVLPLPEAQSVGGRVTDESGKPVADASITLNLPQRLAGPRVAVEDLALKSGADGSWHCDVVPKDAAYLLVEVSHPDFDSPTSDFALEALRAGTAGMKLFAVATLRGRVLDDGGNGVADAEVNLGNEREIWPGSSTLEARADAAGRFEFPRLRFEKRLLGVHAPGFAPMLQLIQVKRDAASLEIHLKQGAPLRVRVVDHAGQPLAGVQAKVDEWPSGLRNAGDGTPGRWDYPGWEWETDAGGRVVWSNAPPEMALWTFTKGGYMSRGREGLKPAPGEQVLKLGPTFRASGSVTDAATGRPVNEFVLTPRFAQTHLLNNFARTNFGGWSEYNRKNFTNGAFSFYRDSPLLSGGREMHDWQFRVEADGYAPAVSRLVRDEERGVRLEFQLTPRPLPDLPVLPPTGTQRVTAGVAVQPRTVRVGDTITLFVRARIASGHHIYALDDSGCSNLPTTLDATARSVLTPEGSWRGPDPKLNDDGSRTIAGDVLFRRRFLIGNGIGGRIQKLPVTLRFQVCNDAVCWPPETISLEAGFEVVNSPE